MNAIGRVIAGFMVATLPVAVLAQASPAPSATPGTAMRRLVYAFTYGESTDLERNTSGIEQSGGGGGPMSHGSTPSGMSDATAGTQDQGTITVDVVREQPDKGLVLVVSEQARGRRSADPATCVVYADTSTVCDTRKKVNDEELTLLRFLGAGFVDPARIDANRHWKVHPSTGDASIRADYSIASDTGGKMTIDETRVITTKADRTFDVYSTIDYDFNRSVPTHVVSNMIERSATASTYTTNTSETTLTLRDDTMKSAPSPAL